MVVYDSGDSQQLIQAMTANLNSAKEVYRRLAQGGAHLIEVINSGVLSGAAYEAGKELFVTYIVPMLQKLSQAISDIENDLKAYKSADAIVQQAGSHLDEAQLKQQLTTVKEMIRLVQQKIKDDQDFINEFMSGFTQVGELPTLQTDLNNLEQVKEMYEKQLKALATFVSSTSSLFTDSAEAFKYALQGVNVINQTGASANGTITFPAGADMSWVKSLEGEKFDSSLNFDSTTSKLNTKGMSAKEKAAYTASVSQTLTSLEEQGWSPKALKAYVNYLNKVAGKYKGSDTSNYMLKVVPATGSILSLCDGSKVSTVDDVNTNVQTVSDILKGAVPGNKTSGKSDIWEKPGSYEEAKNDFESLQPQNVKPFKMPKGGEGEAGTLADGQYVIVRPGSSDTRPTLQIKKTADKSDKDQWEIRYGEKTSDSPEMPKIPDVSENTNDPAAPDIPDDGVKPDEPDIPETPEEPVDPDFPLFP